MPLPTDHDEFEDFRLHCMSSIEVCVHAYLFVPEVFQDALDPVQLLLQPLLRRLQPLLHLLQLLRVLPRALLNLLIQVRQPFFHTDSLRLRWKNRILVARSLSGRHNQTSRCSRRSIYIISQIYLSHHGQKIQHWQTIWSHVWCKECMEFLIVD